MERRLDALETRQKASVGVAEHRVTFDEAVALAKAGKADCVSFPAVISARAESGGLVLVLGDLEEIAMVILRADEPWPRALLAETPVLICFDKDRNVVWVGHAGFDGQKKPEDVLR